MEERFSNKYVTIGTATGGAHNWNQRPIFADVGTETERSFEASLEEGRVGLSRRLSIWGVRSLEEGCVSKIHAVVIDACSEIRSNDSHSGD